MDAFATWSLMCCDVFVTDGGPYHGLIDMFGGIGGTVEHRAALLASRGFATLALRYIDVTTGFKITTDLDYFKVGIMQYSFLQQGVNDVYIHAVFKS